MDAPCPCQKSSRLFLCGRCGDFRLGAIGLDFLDCSPLNASATWLLFLFPSCPSPQSPSPVPLRRATSATPVPGRPPPRLPACPPRAARHGAPLQLCARALAASQHTRALARPAQARDGLHRRAPRCVLSRLCGLAEVHARRRCAGRPVTAQCPRIFVLSFAPLQCFLRLPSLSFCDGLLLQRRLCTASLSASDALRLSHGPGRRTANPRDEGCMPAFALRGVPAAKRARASFSGPCGVTHHKCLYY